MALRPPDYLTTPTTLNTLGATPTHSLNARAKLFSLSNPTAEDVAAQLNLSVRTLHRQLKEEGVSLQKLKNDARREHAMKLLLQTRKPIKQIAAAVGFDSEKSFARAFREWVGVAPSAFRAEEAAR